MAMDARYGPPDVLLGMDDDDLDDGHYDQPPPPISVSACDAVSAPAISVAGSPTLGPSSSSSTAAARKDVPLSLPLMNIHTMERSLSESSRHPSSSPISFHLDSDIAAPIIIHAAPLSPPLSLPAPAPAPAPSAQPQAQAPAQQPSAAAAASDIVIRASSPVDAAPFLAPSSSSSSSSSSSNNFPAAPSYDAPPSHPPPHSMNMDPVLAASTPALQLVRHASPVMDRAPLQSMPPADHHDPSLPPPLPLIQTRSTSSTGSQHDGGAGGGGGRPSIGSPSSSSSSSPVHASPDNVAIAMMPVAPPTPAAAPTPAPSPPMQAQAPAPVVAPQPQSQPLPSIPSALSSPPTSAPVCNILNRQRSAPLPNVPATIDITRRQDEYIEPLRRTNWWWWASILAFVLAAGGGSNLSAGIQSTACTSGLVEDECVCGWRERSVGMGSAAMGSGLMTMMISLMFHGCHHNVAVRRAYHARQKHRAAAAEAAALENQQAQAPAPPAGVPINVPPSPTPSLSASRSTSRCERWFKYCNERVRDMCWAPGSPFLVETDRWNMGMMMAGFLILTGGVSSSWWTDPCLFPELDDTTGTGPKTRACYCIPRESMISIGAGLLGAFIPVLVCVVLFRQDIARQKLIQATMRMIHHKSNNTTTTGVADHGSMRACTSCGANVPTDSRFCGHCAAPVVHTVISPRSAANGGQGAADPSRCTRCHAQNPQSSRFCLQCGMSLQSQSVQHIPGVMAAPMLMAVSPRHQ